MTFKTNREATRNACSAYLTTGINHALCFVVGMLLSRKTSLITTRTFDGWPFRDQLARWQSKRLAHRQALHPTVGDFESGVGGQAHAGMTVPRDVFIAVEIGGDLGGVCGV